MATRKKTTINGLRTVKVEFANGDYIVTNMNGSLSDADIKNYYKIGRIFNLGASDQDNMQPVVKVTIIK